MKEQSFNKGRPLKYKEIIVTLCVMSILAYVLSCIFAFLTEGMMGSMFLLALFQRVLLPILLLIYVFQLHDRTENSFCVPCVFLLFAFSVNFIVFIIVAYLVNVKGYSEKKVISIPQVLGMASGFYNIIIAIIGASHYYSYSYDFDLWIIFHYCTVGLSIILFHAALLLLGLNNRITALSSIISWFSRKKKVETVNSEQALLLLQDKLDLGLISEEEYQIKRKEIINRI